MTPESFWVVDTGTAGDIFITEAAANELNAAMIKYYSGACVPEIGVSKPQAVVEILDINGARNFVPLGKIIRVYESTPESREADRQLGKMLEDERGWDA